MVDVTPTFRPANFGSALKPTPRGALLLQFTPERILCLRGPPRPVASEKTLPPAGPGPHPVLITGVVPGGRHWQGVARPLGLPLGRLLRQADAEARIAAGLQKAEELPFLEQPSPRPAERILRRNALAFLSHFAPEVTAELRAPYPASDWQLLRLLHASPEARTRCAEGQRALVYAWSQGRWLAQDPWAERAEASLGRLATQRRWLKKRPHEALARLGFPTRKASLRILNRLPLPELDLDLLRALRGALSDPDAFATLCHLEAPCAAHVLFLQPRFLARLTPALLRALSECRDRRHAENALREAMHLQDLEEQLGTRRRPRWVSLEQIRELHDARTAEAARSEALPHYVFPPPPLTLSGDERDFLRPLPDSAALRAEGAAQAHCLGKLLWHHEGARAGHFYAWAVEGRERATLALEHNGERWQIYDLRCAGNEPVSAPLLALGVRLLARANAGKA